MKLFDNFYKRRNIILQRDIKAIKIELQTLKDIPIKHELYKSELILHHKLNNQINKFTKDIALIVSGIKNTERNHRHTSGSFNMPTVVDNMKYLLDVFDGCRKQFYNERLTVRLYKELQLAKKNNLRNNFKAEESYKTLLKMYKQSERDCKTAVQRVHELRIDIKETESK